MLEQAGVTVAAYLSCETDERATRDVRYSWPTRTEVSSITRLTGRKIAGHLEAHPRILLLRVVAGFPCKGLSSSNIHGAGLRDKQSVFLFELVRLLAELRQELTIKVHYHGALSG